MKLSSPEQFLRQFRFLELPAALFLLGLLVSCASKTADFKPALPDTPASTDTININTANESELQRLPAIGPKTAAKIVEHRRVYGKFQSPAELMLVEGIGEKQYLRIENSIRIR